MSCDILVRYLTGRSALYKDAKIYVLDEDKKIASISSEGKSQLIFLDRVEEIKVIKE